MQTCMSRRPPLRRSAALLCCVVSAAMRQGVLQTSDRLMNRLNNLNLQKLCISHYNIIVLVSVNHLTQKEGYGAVPDQTAPPVRAEPHRRARQQAPSRG